MQGMKEEGREIYFGLNVALFSKAAGGGVDNTYHNHTEIKVMYKRWTLCLIDKLIKHTLSKSEIFIRNYENYTGNCLLFFSSVL